MPPLDSALRLGTLPLGAGMGEVFSRQVQLILLRVGTATILRAPIGQDPAEGDLTGITERHHLGIEQIRRR